MALQLLQNYNSHHAWTGWDDGSCNLATAAEPHRLCNTAVPIQVLHNLWPSSSRSPHNSVSSRSPHNSVSNAWDGTEDAILYEQSADSDASDSEEPSSINVDSSDEQFLGFPDD